MSLNQFAMKYVLAFDQGTTSSRSIIFNRESSIVSLSQKEFMQIFPAGREVEHNPLEIWETQKNTAVKALKKVKISGREIAGVGITNQRETTVIWNRNTGEPVYNAIVWQDRRTADFCTKIKSDYDDLIRRKTGLEVDAYFSASKIKWVLENVKDARKKAERGELAFGTIDSWLIWKLTDGKLHITDVSNASRTMLFNIQTLEWDAELLKIFGIPYEILPEVKSSSEVYGEISSIKELRGIPISGIAGDQQAALFGQTCFEKGTTKNTYGTGCFILQNTGNKPALSGKKLLTTVAWQIKNKTEYALEGSVFIGGAVVQWLRDSLQIIKKSSDVEALANTVSDNGGVFFVPAFVGLGTPYWNQNARGTIVGLTRGTGKAHIARAALESIAFQTADLLESMQADSNTKLSELRVDGGAASNETLLQFQADILQIPVVRSKISETTALGAAYLAGLAIGFWKDKKELSESWSADKSFEPKMNAKKAKNLRADWQRAVAGSLDWEREND